MASRISYRCSILWRRIRPWIAVAAFFGGLTLLATWPVAARWTQDVAQNPRWSRDAFQQIYELWWFKKALLDLHTSPGDLQWIYFPTGAHYPLLLTYSLVYAVGIPFLWFLSPIATYNLIFLLTFFLSGMTAYALCVRLTGNRWAGLLGGTIYAFYPNRMAHALAGHLELISTYLFPLYLLLLIETARRPRWRTAIACGVVLGGSLLVQPLFIPYLLLPATVACLAGEVRRDQGGFDHRVWQKLGVSYLLAALIAAPLFWPVVHEQLNGQGSYLQEIGAVRFAADLLGIVSPSPAHPLFRLLGSAPTYTQRVAPDDWRIAELLTYAGLVPLTLGIWAAIRRRHATLPWSIMALLAAILSLGPLLKVNGEIVTFVADGVESAVALPYALLTNLPLLSLNRAPARINATLMLALAVLASYGLAELLRRTGRIGKSALALGMCALTFGEMLVIWPCPTTTPHIPAYLSAIARGHNDGAVVNLPVTAGHVQQTAILYQTVHERPVFDSWFQRALPVFPDVALFLDGLLAPSSILSQEIIPATTPAEIAAVTRAEGCGYVFLFTPYIDGVAAEAHQARLTEAFAPSHSTEYGVAIYEVPAGSEKPTTLVYALPNNDWRYPRRGWHDPEEWNRKPARWLSASADLFIYSPDARRGRLRFSALPYTDAHRLQISVNREPLPPLVISQWITYTTPLFDLSPGLNQITLQTLTGCNVVIGDPRCSGVFRAASGDQGQKGECAPYITAERCISVLFQDIRFVSNDAAHGVEETGDTPARFPIEATVGGNIRLRGYDLPDEPRAGRPFPIVLYWEAIGPVSTDVIIFAHLLTADGQLVVQHDAPPVGGVYPTSRWVVGDIFTHRVTLDLPPDLLPGPYDLVVGMYTYPDITRLPVESERPYAQDGLIWLRQVEVLAVK